MDVTSIDYWATGRTSFLHRRAVAAKLLAWALVLAGVIVSQNLLVITAIYISLAAAVHATRLPTRQVLGLAAYPVIFALLFAVSQLQEAGLLFGLTVIAKAGSAALDTVLLISTTPYPEVFGFAQRYLPPTIGDGLFMTYRSVFILTDKLQHVVRAIRLRGGLSRRRLGRNLGNVGVALGTLMIDSVDYSQRLYAIMRVRGYQGRIAAEKSYPWRAAEIEVVAAGGVLLSVSLVFRIWYQVLNPVSWLPPLLAILLLGLEGARAWSR